MVALEFLVIFLIFISKITKNSGFFGEALEFLVIFLIFISKITKNSGIFGDLADFVEPNHQKFSEFL